MTRIALPPDTEVEAAFHQLVNAAIDQVRPSPGLREATNRVLALIGHPLAIGRQSEIDNPGGLNAARYAARHERREA